MPILSIDPWNLVPACERCNHRLQARFVTTAEEQLFHPYSMPDLGRWLYAEVESVNPLKVTYRAVPDPSFNELIQARILNEFESLSLEPLYSLLASSDQSEMAVTLYKKFSSGPPELVRAHLLDAADCALLSTANSRRGALFEALAGSAEYCAGGFKDNIPDELIKSLNRSREEREE